MMTPASSNCSTSFHNEKERISSITLLLSFLFIGFLAPGCTSGERSGSPDNITEAEPVLESLFSYYKNGNYFKLRDGLLENPSNDHPKILFLSAVFRHAFNEPAESNRIIGQILSRNDSFEDSLVNKLRSLKLENHLRLHQYPEALEAATAIIETPDAKIDSADVANAENIYQLLEVLADTPPQKVAARRATSLQMNRDKAGLQRVPVSIGGIQRRFVLDTGANFSVLIRSEAMNLGLAIKEAGVKVNSATGAKVQADVAVAEEVTFGGIVYRDVVFLVFPDEAMSFPQIDYQIPGIIGFPLIEAAGEIRFKSDDVLEIPEAPASYTIHNMALKGLNPRVQVEIQVSTSSPDSLLTEPLVCALDTGAPETSIFVSFYQRNRSWIDQLGRRDTIQVGGAGGSKNMSVYWLQDAQLRIGNKTATLEEITVHTESVSPENNEEPACNMGQDVLGQFNETVINFQSMSFLLR